LGSSEVLGKSLASDNAIPSQANLHYEQRRWVGPDLIRAPAGKRGVASGPLARKQNFAWDKK
jgi:hypothetical protein